MEILNNIPFEPDVSGLMENLHIQSGSEHEAEFMEFLETLQKQTCPKALFKVSYIDNRTDDTVTIGNVTFSSRVLQDNVKEVERVFPYIATCGTEMDEIDCGGDFLREYWLDAIKLDALRIAQHYLKEFINKKYTPGPMSSMNPGGGSIDLWPLEQQEVLFSLLGNTEEHIGVTLTESFLMLPNKSVSGILFPSEVTFTACRLCPRKNCRGRRAPFSREEYDKYHSPG